MLRLNVLRIVLIGGLMLAATYTSAAQTKTAEELKAEREQLKTEMLSEEAKERQEEIKELFEDGMPDSVEINSINELAVGSTKILASTVLFNKSVPEMYKRTIGETVDGVTDVSVKKPTLDELTLLAAEIATAISGANDLQKAVPQATTDLKDQGWLKAILGVFGGGAGGSLNYSKDALSLSLPELQQNAKVVQHLIETLKSSGNY